MAHKSNGYVYTTDAVPSLIRNGSLTFLNRLELYSEQAATLVMHEGSKHERVYTESEVGELIKAGNALSVAMKQYEMDVDEDPPYKHRQMMSRWEGAVRRLFDPA